jgi:hypothetical protein
MTTGIRKTGEFCWINMLTPDTAKARATVCMPLKDIPGVGRMSGITSPQGVNFYVITYSARAAD